MVVGERVIITYDARPLEEVKMYEAEIAKITKIGFKVKNLDKPGLYEDVIFYPYGTAKGWNTLTWRYPCHWV